MLKEFIGHEPSNIVMDLRIDEAAAKHVINKGILYRIAAMMLVLLKQEESVPELHALRVELERRVYTVDGYAAAALLIAIPKAMSDLADLFECSDEQMSWARKWLREVNVDETNPALLVRFAMQWYDFFNTAVKAIHTLRLV